MFLFYLFVRYNKTQSFCFTCLYVIIDIKVFVLPVCLYVVMNIKDFVSPVCLYVVMNFKDFVLPVRSCYIEYQRFCFTCSVMLSSVNSSSSHRGTLTTRDTKTTGRT
jgi:hypothetical protein